MKNNVKGILKVVFISLALLWGIVLINDIFQDWRFKRQWVKELKRKQDEGYSTITRSIHYPDSTRNDSIKSNE